MTPEELFARYEKLAYMLARRYLKKHGLKSYHLPKIENDALIGLWKACQAFDPEKTTNFQTYASIRIHGEIMDSFRSENGREQYKSATRRRGGPTRIPSRKYVHLSTLLRAVPECPNISDDDRLSWLMEDKKSSRSYDRLDDHDDLELALSVLPNAYVPVFRCLIQGYSQVETAAMTGLSQSRVSRLVKQWLPTMVERIRRTMCS